MSENYKYTSILDKYGLSDIKKDYVAQIDAAEGRPVSVGIFGEGSSIRQLLTEILQLSELNSVFFTRAFVIRIIYGEEKRYSQLVQGAEQILSFDEFTEKLRGDDLLSEEEDIFEGNIALPNAELKELSLFVATLSNGIDDMMLLNNDICAVALDATHLLSLEERRFLKNPLNTKKYYFLCDYEKVHKEDRNQVKSLLEAYIPDKRYWTLPLEESEYTKIQAEWKSLSDLYESRIAKIDTYTKPQIEQAIRKKLTAMEHESNLMQQLISHLDAAKSELPTYKDKTVRYVYMNYITGIKEDTTSEVLRFYEKMNEDITSGIQEEKDIKSLQEELPNYIAGEWAKFIDKNLNLQIQTSAEKVIPAIEEYIDSKTELYLKEVLTAEEYEYITIIVSELGQIDDKIAGGTDAISGNTSLDKTENMTLRKVLPKCLIALGGIVMLSSSFIPGALLLAAGWKGNSDVIEEIQQELIKEGKKLNHNYLKEVQTNLEQLMERIKAETEVTVEQCYSNVIDSLIQFIHSYQEQTRELNKKISSINYDLENL